MDVMGWSNSAMVRRYSHVTARLRRDIADRLNSFLWTANETELSYWQVRRELVDRDRPPCTGINETTNETTPSGRLTALRPCGKPSASGRSPELCHPDAAHRVFRRCPGACHS